MTRSRILAAGDRSVICRYDVPSSAGFPGFKSGKILPIFQLEGIVAVLRVRLNNTVRYSMPQVPRCFNMIGEVPHVLRLSNFCFV